MMRRASGLLALILALLPAIASAACRDLDHGRQSFTVCEAQHGRDDLRLFLRAPDGHPYASFERVRAALAPAGLGWAMNAGMYQPDRSPVGLYLENGATTGRLVTSDGPGNFGLLPNGVFCIGPGRYRVVESRAFAKSPPACSFATQSGPLLVIKGKLHPKFLPGSSSRYIRNGVGISPDGQVAYFLISNEPVNFTEFAAVFRDVLGAPNALYFDGSISRLYAPALGRRDPGFAMGPMVGIVVPAAH